LNTRGTEKEEKVMAKKAAGIEQKDIDLSVVGKAGTITYEFMPPVFMHEETSLTGHLLFDVSCLMRALFQDEE
jgi:hypothetical protein